MTIAQKLRDSITDGWSGDAAAADATVAIQAAVILDDMLSSLKVAEAFVEYLASLPGGLVLVGSMTPDKCLARIRSSIAKASA